MVNEQHKEVTLEVEAVTVTDWISAGAEALSTKESDLRADNERLREALADARGSFEGVNALIMSMAGRRSIHCETAIERIDAALQGPAIMSASTNADVAALIERLSSTGGQGNG